MQATSTTPLRRHLLALLGVLALVMALVPFAASSATAQEDDGAADALDLDGESNVEYAVNWSQVTYTPLEGEVDNAPTEALLGRDDLFADNLAAGSLMGQAIDNGRPLYLTDSLSLDSATLAEMQRVLPEDATVHILGGTEAISPAVEVELTAAGFTVNRFEGETRVETAVDIAGATDSDTVLVVRAFPTEGSTDETQAFADSLGAGALAATNGWEILFTQSEVLTGSTADALEAGEYSQAYVVGGDQAIAESVSDEIATMVDATERVAGNTRFETAIALNELREGATGEAAIIVDGQADDAWADGFPAANLSGLNGYPVVLSNQGEIPAETEAFLQGFRDADTTTFAAHFTDVALVCGNTVDLAACTAALAAINGGEGGEVRPFPPAPDEGPADNEVVTAGPELLRVTVEDQTADDVDLRFTFDEQITGKAPVAECFHLYLFDLSDFGADDDATDCTTAGGGHDGDVNANPASADGDVAQIATDDQTSVVVNFDVDEEEFERATVATVDWDAVQDDDGIENLEADYAMAAATIAGGVTDAPDLEGIRNVDVEVDTVDFVFDEDVAEAITNPEGFVLIDDDGDTLVGDAAELSPTDGEDNVVRVTFDDAANDESAGSDANATGAIESDTEASIVRAGVQAASVTGTDEAADANPLQTVDVAADGTTDDPDLVSVDVDRANDTVTYTFDVAVQLDGTCEPVLEDLLPIPGSGTAEACFQVYDRTGTETNATAVTRGMTDNTTVVAEFADGILEDALGASVDADAVSDINGTENPGNEIDELPIAGQDVPAGMTTGPDLVSATTTTTGDLGTQTVVEYTFDEDIVLADDPATTDVDESVIDAGRFFVYNADGTPARGATAMLDEDDESVVQVIFADNEDTIADAVVATVNDLAVSDEDGDSNPEGVSILS